jgi:translation elongation factor EF-G
MTHPHLISVAITPKTKADQEKLGVGLQKLMVEDPTLRINTTQTGQTIVHAMRELHLEIIFDRLKREFSVEAMAGKPQIAYKEMLTSPADGEMKYAKHVAAPTAKADNHTHLSPWRVICDMHFRHRSFRPVHSRS